MPNIGWVELALILVIVTMLFGGGKLPDVFGSVGKGIREFRKEAGTDNKSADADDAKASEKSAETSLESK
jgi:sec-independent protein translocase protein TatA